MTNGGSDHASSGPGVLPRGPALDGKPGTYVTFSGGKFLYRRRLKAPPAKALPPAAATAHTGAIVTASVDDLIGSSPEDALHDIQQRIHRFPYFWVYLVLAAATLCLAAVQSESAVLFGTLAVALSAAGIAIFVWDRECRTARIIYDIENGELMERFSLCSQAGKALSGAQGLWHIFYSISTDDQKRNAGATHLIRRTRVASVPRSLHRIVCNVQPWSIPAGPQQVLLLPDRLLIHQDGRFAAVPYQDLQLATSESRFIETERLPADAKVVGKTWRYVRKNGGPDRRFNNNAELPVALYGELEMRSSSGVRLVFQTSTPAAAASACAALAHLQQLGDTPMTRTKRVRA